MKDTIEVTKKDHDDSQVLFEQLMTIMKMSRNLIAQLVKNHEDSFSEDEKKSIKEYGQRFNIISEHIHDTYKHST